ncbi:DUF3021 domain-containing protein [Lactobacillus intestinalis]|uniref:DUF3021 domain-containing protein n=1 Tax=Lactobacillus intestinalis TaxID=151781 RepID=UPI001F5888BC|nr:DUF3021 domain-containing protein [Lactobacillus intestinalis]
MKWFGKCVDYFFTGMGFGAICYVCILTFFNPGIAPTVRETISVLGISGVIGLLSMIFKTDLPMSAAFALHFVGTFILFIFMAIINQWSINISSIVIFILMYGIIWLICLLEQKKTVNRINDRIKKRNLK